MKTKKDGLHSFISVVVDSQGEKSGIGHFFANTGSNVQ